MPQLKKVVLSVGNSLIYTDTYEQALTALGSLRTGAPVEVTQTSAPPTAPALPAPPANADQRIQQVRQHLQRFRELSGQGKWAEAGRELDAIESAVQK